MDSSDVDSDSSSIYSSDAQKEWEASLQQLELVLTMVIVPYAGKYFGRKFAYWSKFFFIDLLISFPLEGDLDAVEMEMEREMVGW